MVVKVAILKERTPGENRVAATPETVKKMVALGMDVIVEKGAGEGSSIPDQHFKDAGAEIASTPLSAIKGASVVLSVRSPLHVTAKDLKAKKEDQDVLPLHEGTLVLGQLSPYQNPVDLHTFAKQGVSALSLELIPRISRAQSMDVLSSQSNLAGYRAVLEAATVYGRSFPMMMTAAGTVTPAKVLVLGAGVAGLQAIATARRLGAVVTAYDVRAAAKEQVESLGAKFIAVEIEETGEGSGGYAKEMSKDYQKLQDALLAKVLPTMDMVITTALIPGKKAPLLVTQSMVESMKPGSVVVDMAVEMGGNCEASSLDEVVDCQGVKVVGYGNLASRLAQEASNLYARNILNLINLIYDPEEKALALNLEDEIIKGSLLTHKGKMIHPNFQ